MQTGTGPQALPQFRAAPRAATSMFPWILLVWDAQGRGMRAGAVKNLSSAQETQQNDTKGLNLGRAGAKGAAVTAGSAAGLSLAEGTVFYTAAV